MKVSLTARRRLTAHPWRSLARLSRRSASSARLLSTVSRSASTSQSSPAPWASSASFSPSTAPEKIKTYPPPPSLLATIPNKDPVAYITSLQLTTLDPTGARSQLFSKKNPEAAKVGDILLVRLKNGDPFAGVCLNIRRRGVDTGILLRNELTRIGVEMWFKVFSPNVEAVEVVQRREKRARRARLYYMRKPKHDMRSVQGVVQQYLRQRAMLRSGDARSREQGKRGGDKKKR